MENIAANNIAAKPVVVTPEEPQVFHAKEETHEHTAALPLELYEKENDKPYLVDLFGLNEYPNLKRQPEGDFDGILEKIDLVDGHLKSKIKDRGMELSQDSYKFLIEEIFKAIGKTETESGENKLKRLFAYIYKTQLLTEREKEIELLKEQLCNTTKASIP